MNPQKAPMQIGLMIVFFLLANAIDLIANGGKNFTVICIIAPAAALLLTNLDTLLSKKNK